MVATRLHAQDPSVARLGPDLFGLQLEGRHTAAELAREFERLSERCFGEPFVVFGEEIRIGCRIGAAVFPGDGVDAENLLLNAEEALRRAKNTLLPYVFYAPKMNATAAQAPTSATLRRNSNQRFTGSFQTAQARLPAKPVRAINRAMVDFMGRLLGHAL